MNMKRTLASLLVLVLLALAGCGGKTEPPASSAAPAGAQSGEGTAPAPVATPRPGEENAPKIDGLVYESTVPLAYADQFAIYRYEGGYRYIDMANSDKMLVIPEGKPIPAGLAKDVVAVQQPLQHIYLPATSVMALFDALDALGRISFVGSRTWYTENAIRAMENGDFVYAGKYNTPDYEMLLAGGCDLAIESTMILHNPEVKEKLTEIGIKTVVERSSYEDHPLGRTEWIKVYGAILGLEAQADAVFGEQMEKVKALEALASTGKTVAFFYVNTAGNVVTYKSEGYLPSMIKIAGGEYIFSELGAEDDTGKLSTVNMSMEQFYHSAVNADIIIYNCSIAAQLHTIDDLTSLSPVLADFKAVKEGNAWCTTESMYQQTDKMGTIIEEMNRIFSGQTDGSDLDYIFRLE